MYDIQNKNTSYKEGGKASFASPQICLLSDDVEFSMQTRLLIALAFIATINVIHIIEELIFSTSFLQMKNLLTSIINYFEDSWFGRSNRNNWR
jgi:hypothetical protein